MKAGRISRRGGDPAPGIQWWPHDPEHQPSTKWLALWGAIWRLFSPQALRLVPRRCPPRSALHKTRVDRKPRCRRRPAKKAYGPKFADVFTLRTAVFTAMPRQFSASFQTAVQW